MKHDRKGTRDIMRKSILICIAAGLIAMAAAAQDPVSVLKSDAPREQKQAALREISVHGGVETVAVVAGLLLDPEYSHMARYALEPMPCAEAGQALRAALANAEGKIKAGLVHSLGKRRDGEAFGSIVPLLRDADGDVAQAAARALARISPDEAVKPLQDALAQPNLAKTSLWVFCDALFMCAEASNSTAVYDYARNIADAPAHVRAGAFRGAVLGRGEAGLALLLEGLSGDDGVIRNAALRTAREMPAGDAIDSGLAGALAGLDAAEKIRLMQVLGERRGTAAGPALMAEAAGGDTGVRVAALKAMTQMAYGPAVDVLVVLALAEDAGLSGPARDCLGYFPGNAGDAALMQMLGSEKAEVRCAAVEMAGSGALADPVAVLMNAIADADQSVRVAAYKGLQDSAGADEVPGLLAALEKSASAQEMQAVEKTLQSVCGRQKRMPGSVIVQHAVYGDVAGGNAKDVTAQVAQMVESGTTYVDATNANFGDTAPGKPKSLRVEFVQNGAPYTWEVEEGETLRFNFDSAPLSIVDAFLAAFDRAQGEAKLAVVRLLGATGHAKALETVENLAATGEGAVKDAASRALCEWPNSIALPVIMEMSENSSDETLKVLALRGAVRLIGQSSLSTAERLAHYADLMDDTATADGKKAVLGGIAELPSPEAFGLALQQAGNEAVRAEAIQAAIDIAKEFGEEAREDNRLVQAADFDAWDGDRQYWRLEDGVIIGQSTSKLDHNLFLWPGIEATDFYMAVDIKLEPNTGNGGVQFRSARVDASGAALGYQADVGKDVWGRIYHERGRGKLDWNDRAEAAVKPGEWNRYEILAVGPAVWTFINGQIGAAMLDFEGERAGLLAMQLHGGPPQTVQYRFRKLVHHPKIDIEGYPVATLIKELKALPAK